MGAVYRPLPRYDAPVRVQKLVRRGEAALKASPAIDHWQKHREEIEAEELLEHLMGRMPRDDERVPEGIESAFTQLIERRAAGEPVSLITGYTDFLGIDLMVEPGVFVPRDSSEFLAIQAIRRLKGRKRPVLVDLATGAGTIALAVASHSPRTEIYGTDIARDAVALARRNAKRLGLRARFLAGDLFEGLPASIRGRVSVVTLHPPYVPVDEVPSLPEEVRAWEPAHTLTDGSTDGMGLVERAAADAPAWLSKNGWILLEADPDAARDVRRRLTQAGFRDVRTTSGGELKVTRVIVGRRPA
jgi:release factor glutamine methyltransferase